MIGRKRLLLMKLPYLQLSSDHGLVRCPVAVDQREQDLTGDIIGQIPDDGYGPASISRHLRPVHFQDILQGVELGKRSARAK